MRSLRSEGRAAHGRARGRNAAGGGSIPGRLREAGATGDPMNLLDASAVRQLARSASRAGGQRHDADEAPAFDVGEDGRMVIAEDVDAYVGRGSKRKRSGALEPMTRAPGVQCGG